MFTMCTSFSYVPIFGGSTKFLQSLPCLPRLPGVHSLCNKCGSTLRSLPCLSSVPNLSEISMYLYLVDQPNLPCLPCLPGVHTLSDI